MRFRYLLFDLDGTLTDPKEGITASVQYALRSFGIEEPDLDRLTPFIGPPLKDSFMDSMRSRRRKLSISIGNGFGLPGFFRMPFIRASGKCWRN